MDRKYELKAFALLWCFFFFAILATMPLFVEFATNRQWHMNTLTQNLFAAIASGSTALFALAILSRLKLSPIKYLWVIIIAITTVALAYYNEGFAWASDWHVAFKSLGVLGTIGSISFLLCVILSFFPPSKS